MAYIQRFPIVIEFRVCYSRFYLYLLSLSRLTLWFALRSVRVKVSY